MLLRLGKSSFKPCYKWNTFNTTDYCPKEKVWVEVLNLIITGLPSIHKFGEIVYLVLCFKPYYNWNTFNTGHNN